MPPVGLSNRNLTSRPNHFYASHAIHKSFPVKYLASPKIPLRARISQCIFVFMRILTPAKLRSILEDPRNAVGFSLNLNLICIAINEYCSRPNRLPALDGPEDDDKALVAKA